MLPIIDTSTLFKISRGSSPKNGYLNKAVPVSIQIGLAPLSKVMKIKSKMYRLGHICRSIVNEGLRKNIKIKEGVVKKPI